MRIVKSVLAALVLALLGYRVGVFFNDGGMGCVAEIAALGGLLVYINTAPTK